MGDVDLTSPIISFTERIVYFMKRVLAALLCAGMLIVFASGCMGGGKQTNPEDVATGDEASSLDPKDYKNNFEGLCNYFAAYGYINPKYDDKNTEMDASLIGAKVGKKFTAIRIDDKDVNSILEKLVGDSMNNLPSSLLYKMGDRLISRENFLHMLKENGEKLTDEEISSILKTLTGDPDPMHLPPMLSFDYIFENILLMEKEDREVNK